MPRMKQSPEGWDKTEQAAEYRQRYFKENYAKIGIAVRPEVRDRIHAAAARQGMTITELIITAVEEYDRNH